jgi:uncharacterized protein YcbK (DUF882 family)
VPVSIARMNRLSSNQLRAGYCGGLAALLILFGCESLQNATAEGDTRTISLHHMHTEEDLTITYKVNGRYDEEALKKISWVLRDWRKEEPIAMDPHLIDLVWEVHRDVGAKEPIWIVCGYRSPQTNSMLRRRSSGVAKFSQHMLGKAMDFYIPGVPLEQLRAVGLYLQRGGVGYYPTSGSPFVHLDTGSVRHWPHVATDQMPRLVAKGRELHVAAESTRPGTRQPANVLAALFGGGKEQEPDPATAAAPRPAPTPARTSVAALEPKAEKSIAAPLPPTRPVTKAAEKPAAKPATFEVASAISKPATFEVASAGSKPVQLRPAQGASLVARAEFSAADVINERGYWQGLPEAAAAEAPQLGAVARTPAPTKRPAGPAVASADPESTASLPPWPLPDRNKDNEMTSGALAYAAPAVPATPARPAAMGSLTARPAPAPAAQPDTTVAVKRAGDRPSVLSQPAAAVPANAKVGERLNDPWMRAMIVSPSAQTFMKTTLFGGTDFRNLAPHLQKPTASVMMTFSADPHLGMMTEQFSGSAVVFVATVTFNQRTAALR